MRLSIHETVDMLDLTPRQAEQILYAIECDLDSMNGEPSFTDDVISLESVYETLRVYVNRKENTR